MVPYATHVSIIHYIYVYDGMTHTVIDCMKQTVIYGMLHMVIDYCMVHRSYRV